MSRSLLSPAVRCIISFSVLFLSPYLMPLVWAQTTTGKNILINIRDAADSTGLTGVTIKIQNGPSGVTDADGNVAITVTGNKINLQAARIGYVAIQHVFRTDTLTQPLVLFMQDERQMLQEVVVTGQEVKGMTSATIINKEAMQVLQPSSFGDLLELLPGGRFSKPDLTASSPMSLRETGVRDRDYYASIFGGVSFLVDGRPLSTQANMQTTVGGDMLMNPESGNVNASRNTMGLGVDMRSLSTDHIEQVEIIRGIPSVQYGNLTSGLVKIKRKAGQSPLGLRFKADGLSKLFYAGKGFQVGSQSFLNVGVDYLRSNGQPTYPLESFNRLTGMVKWDQHWTTSTGRQWKWNLAADISSTLDREKKDSDVGNVEVNSYRSVNRGLTLTNSLERSQPNASFFRNLEWLYTFSLENNRISQTKWVQLLNPSVIPSSAEEGEHDGIYLPGQYISELAIDGRPVNSYTKVLTEHAFDTNWMSHRVFVGGEWSFDKNYGKGQLYDTQRPPSPDMSVRPRSFRSIPANQELSVFAEDRASWGWGAHHIQLLAGVRATRMLGLGREFKKLTSWNLDPRANLSWALPAIDLWSEPLKLAVDLGWGRASRRPGMAQISPDPVYWDFIQLNFFHENPAYRRINLMTFMVDPVNTDLRSASNIKKEIRLNASYRQSNWSLTYFEEDMSNGFRNMADYRSFAFKRYSTEGIDIDNLTAPPRLEDLTYSEEKQLRTYQVTENGSRIHKRGVEFQVSSPRFTFLNTRLTADGAWFYTQYTNSLPAYKEPRNPILVDGKRLQYLGLFFMDEGYKNTMFNSKLSVDNYFPDIGLTLFSSFQFQWYATNQSAWNDGMPLAYVDVEGQERPYTEESLQDPLLRQLRILYGDQAFDKRVTPRSLMVNFKATKHIGQKLRLAMFVNSLFYHIRSKNRQGQEFIGQRTNTPYFGMELNMEI